MIWWTILHIVPYKLLYYCIKYPVCLSIFIPFTHFSLAIEAHRNYFIWGVYLELIRLNFFLHEIQYGMKVDIFLLLYCPYFFLMNFKQCSLVDLKLLILDKLSSFLAGKIIQVSFSMFTISDFIQLQTELAL